MKIACAIAVAAAVAVVWSGCESSSGGGGIEFKNVSSHTVSVSPDEGQKFASFELAPEQSRKVSISGSDIHNAFLYTPMRSVAVDASEHGKVYFYNRGSTPPTCLPFLPQDPSEPAPQPPPGGG